MTRYTSKIVDRTYANDTAEWHVVGNYNELISTHPTKEDAAKSIADLPEDIGASRFGLIQVVAPQGSISGSMQVPVLYEDDTLELALEDLFSGSRKQTT